MRVHVNVLCVCVCVACVCVCSHSLELIKGVDGGGCVHSKHSPLGRALGRVGGEQRYVPKQIHTSSNCALFVAILCMW